jgi:hypothetical protein
MAKPDSNFVYCVTKTGGQNKFCKCVGEICAMLRMKGSSTYAKAHTCKKKKIGCTVNDYDVTFYN